MPVLKWSIRGHGARLCLPGRYLCRKLMKATKLFVFLLIGSILSVSAENWPAWRGPHRDGVSAERNLPLRWDTEENIAWKLALPEQSS